MHMGMSMGQELILECAACEQPMSDHASDCPQGLIEALWNSVQRGRCPACRKDDVFPNSADYFECRSCRTQFSVGLVCGGEDPDTLEMKILDLANARDLTPVKQMKTPGTGDIPVLKQTRALRVKLVATKVARRAAKREFDRVYNRIMKREEDKAKKGGTR